MRVGTLARRFLVPGLLVSAWAYLRHRCLVSPRAEVELSRRLRIGRGSVIGSFTKIKATDGPLRIGRDVHVATGCFITSHEGGLEIGDDCLVGPNVSIVASNYRYDALDRPIARQPLVSRGIRIADNVWIGAGAVVLDGADIGEGCIITPNTVVGGTIPAHRVVTGNPGRVVFVRR
jgi:acetyltransferase-like isoleucine patch superfamily enzyme